MAGVSCKPLVFFCVFLSLCNWSVLAAPVMSIDLGSEWLKVAVVNLKPGQPPISIAPNEMSKRKSPALVAFSKGDRLVSEEASGILARYPERVFASLRDMVGKSYGAVKELVKAQHLPYDVVEDASGRARIRVGEDSGSVLYSIEELLAMLLNYARELAESHTKESIKDTVITVPPYFGQAERKGLLDAADIADLNVLTLKPWKGIQRRAVLGVDRTGSGIQSDSLGGGAVINARIRFG